INRSVCGTVGGERSRDAGSAEERRRICGAGCKWAGGTDGRDHPGSATGVGAGERGRRTEEEGGIEEAVRCSGGGRDQRGGEKVGGGRGGGGDHAFIVHTGVV